MNPNNLITAALIVACAFSTGCQSWQGASFPLPNSTRVPPPGTGTYQLPSGYYNNATSALPTNQTMQTVDSASGLRTVTGAFPSTNMPATNLVSSANYVQAPIGATSPPVMAASHAQLSDGPAMTAGTATAVNDPQTVEAPSLQWQQFGGQ